MCVQKIGSKIGSDRKSDRIKNRIESRIGYKIAHQPRTALYFDKENQHIYNDIYVVEPHGFLREKLKMGDRIVMTWYYNERNGFMENTVTLNSIRWSAMTTVLMRDLKDM